MNEKIALSRAMAGVSGDDDGVTTSRNRYWKVSTERSVSAGPRRYHTSFETICRGEVSSSVTFDPD